jgi:phosphoserine phosphatase
VRVAVGKSAPPVARLASMLDPSPPINVRWPEFAHVVFDCDSTLSTVEGIDVLAEGLRLEAEVTALTDAAMAGEIDLSDIYGARLEMLRPTEQAVAGLRAAYKRNIVEDAFEVVAALREIGIAVYVVSGGLVEPVVEFAVHLGIDRANVRGVQARYDELSGEWWRSGQTPEKAFAGFEAGALTRSDGKPEVIRELLGDARGLTMLVGDGASDQRAADTVDLFVGFGGVVRRERVEELAPIYVTAKSLAPVLPIAAGPGGRLRLTSPDAVQVFERGVALLEQGDVTFHDQQKRETLLAALGQRDTQP